MKIMLTKNEILNEMEMGNILIEPFREEYCGPNSVDLHLSSEVLVYDEVIIDPRKTNRVSKLTIPEEGLDLRPDVLYLASTVEHTETNNLIPCIEGRSSIGRLGLHIHVSAGFGDIGFRGSWTLELSCVQPIRIYPFMRICQIYYFKPTGLIKETYEGRYQGQSTTTESRYNKC